MGIRDLLILMLGYLCVPLALIDPFYGLLAYCGLSFMNPQSLAWSPTVMSARMVFAVGAVLVFRAAIAQGPKVRFAAPTWAFLAFGLWVAVATFLSPRPELAEGFLGRFVKIAVPALLLTGLVRERWQLKWLILVLALSPGFYAFKLGQFFFLRAPLTTHGGPLGMDNNDLALFLSMGIPLLVFAATEVKGVWYRRGLYLLAALAVPAVVATGSRGGMLGLVAAGGLTLVRAWNWKRAALVAAITLPLVLAIIPEYQMQRYRSLKTYEHDAAAMGRIRGWNAALRMADASPITGIGLGMDVFLAEYPKYQDITDPEDYPHVAHSVWFSTLAGAGWVGLSLLIALMLATLHTTRRVRRIAVEHFGGKGSWAWNYAVMIECALLVFAVAASFLSQVGFEFVYVVMLLSVPLYFLAQSEADAATARSTALAPVTPPPDALPVTV